jgi:DNA invertase Pin-like site-specific DNA recombinase
MKTVAYLRVSKDSQDTQNQRLAILEFARKEKRHVDHFIEMTVSSRKSMKERKIDLLVDQLDSQDTLIVSELSRMGRSVGQIITTIDMLVKKEIHFIAVKEGIRLSGTCDLKNKMMITMFGLFAEIERDLISMRTKEALAAARAKGTKLGRPKGRLGKSKLDGREQEIQKLLAKQVSKASIAKITEVDRKTLYHFIATRGLQQKP